MSNDLISRQAVQDYITEYLSQYLYNDVREAVEVIDEYIGELPSVNPQEPKTDVLDKIRAEIDSHCSDNRDRNDGLYIAMKIIDKYRECEDKE